MYEEKKEKMNEEWNVKTQKTVNKELKNNLKKENRGEKKHWVLKKRRREGSEINKTLG